MAAWIDFKMLRQELSFLEVLKHYHVDVTVKGDKATGLCPLPGHPQRDNGGKRTPSFSVHLSRKIWRCFGCNAGGNLLDLAVLLDGGDPDNTKAVRRTAVKLAEHFQLDTSDSTATKSPAGRASVSKKPKMESETLVNRPLDFQLQGLDPEHPYFEEHGITPGCAKTFGLGYSARGMLKFRIAIPIHNEKGELVGYAGRLTKDRDISEDNPKYRFPGNREREGKKIEFRKSRIVYNLHRLPKRVDQLIVVEGFRSVWWLHQCSYSHVVAIMGNSCSPEQAELILDRLSSSGHLVFLTDGDVAGEQCAQSLFQELGQKCWCRWVKLTEGNQPTDLPEKELKSMLSFDR